MINENVWLKYISFPLNNLRLSLQYVPERRREQDPAAAFGAALAAAENPGGARAEQDRRLRSPAPTRLPVLAQQQAATAVGGQAAGRSHLAERRRRNRRQEAAEAARAQLPHSRERQRLTLSAISLERAGFSGIARISIILQGKTLT